jgi:hypothetical protein
VGRRTDVEQVGRRTDVEQVGRRTDVEQVGRRTDVEQVGLSWRRGTTTEPPQGATGGVALS